MYGGSRLGYDPTKPQRMVRLRKRQQGRCQLCGLRFEIEDLLDAEGASLGWRPDQATGIPTWGCSTRIATITSTVRVSMTLTRVLRSRVNPKVHARPAGCSGSGAGAGPTDPSLASRSGLRRDSEGFLGDCL